MACIDTSINVFTLFAVLDEMCNSDKLLNNKYTRTYIKIYRTYVMRASPLTWIIAVWIILDVCSCLLFVVILLVTHIPNLIDRMRSTPETRTPQKAFCLLWNMSVICNFWALSIPNLVQQKKRILLLAKSESCVDFSVSYTMCWIYVYIFWK